MKFISLVKIALLVSCNLMTLSDMVRALVNQGEIPKTADIGPKEENEKKISLMECCQDSFNSVGFNDCKNSSQSPDAWLPFVHSLKENETFIQSLDQFQFIYSLPNCSDGFIEKTSTQFNLYEDGSLKTAQGSFQFGEFCIEQMLKSEGDSTLVARYCIRDPCNDTSCIRKCCPDGMAVDRTTLLCHGDVQDFNITIQDERGFVVDENIDGIRYGIPECFEIFSASLADHQFYLLPSGSLYLEELTGTFEEYCVDNQFPINNTAMAFLVCKENLEPYLAKLEPTGLLLRIKPYLWLISPVFLIITFLVYAILPEIRNRLIVMCHVASLATTYVVLGVRGIWQQHGSKPDDPICILIGVMLHFSTLSSFTWMNIMNFDIWWTFRKLMLNSNRRNGLGLRFLIYSIYAWGVPLVFVVTGQVLDQAENLPDSIIRPKIVDECAINISDASLVYNAGPVIVLLLSNIIFFVLTTSLLQRATTYAALATSNRKTKQQFCVVFSIFVLTGVTWFVHIIIYFFCDIENNIFFASVFVILENVLGAYIFFVFICKKKVRKLLKQKWDAQMRKSSLTQRQIIRHAEATLLN